MCPPRAVRLPRAAAQRRGRPSRAKDRAGPATGGGRHRRSGRPRDAGLPAHGDRGRVLRSARLPADATEPRPGAGPGLGGVHLGLSRLGNRHDAIPVTGLRAWARSAADPLIVRRAVATSLVVGSLLTLVNHGDRLVRGLADPGLADPGLAVQVGLTFLVPFLVSTLSGVETRNGTRNVSPTCTARPGSARPGSASPRTSLSPWLTRVRRLPTTRLVATARRTMSGSAALRAQARNPVTGIASWRLPRRDRPR